ncbi:Hypothetical protein CINCED_3A017800 [Cinara cedri]|uniref:Uncharacterized protein n=1 Tax=Cinara cedri TaxID=506608 RepID=A0A5E4MMV8_9HEMI|nr:Hypothetical protein CINCED_3A017800 [Cinara cedri]
MTHTLSDNIKCLDGVDYDVVKNNVHFEWVSGFEDTIKQLASDVFDTIGVKVGDQLNVVLKGFDEFQVNLEKKMDVLVEKVNIIAGSNEAAKTFVAEWAEAVKYQVQSKYHYAGDGPTAQGLRWGYQSSIKYIIICGTTLADKGGDDVEFKKQISDYIKTVIIQSLIDSLENVKNELETLKTSS